MPCQTLPCHAEPDHAQPHHLKRSLRRCLLADLDHALPCLALPGRAEPNLAVPRLDTPALKDAWQLLADSYRVGLRLICFLGGCADSLLSLKTVIVILAELRRKTLAG